MLYELLNIDLIKELGLGVLPDEKKKEMLEQMSEVVENRLNIKILSLLSEDDKKELDTVLESNGDLLAYLQKKIPNFNIVVSEIVAAFKQEMLEINDMTKLAMQS